MGQRRLGHPHLTGLKYFEKPPLQYWATAAAYSVFVIIGQINLLDSAFTFLLSAAVFSLLLACDAPRDSARERNWAVLMWVALALAVLAKGMAAVVLGRRRFIAAKAIADLIAASSTLASPSAVSSRSKTFRQSDLRLSLPSAIQAPPKDALV